MKKFTRYELRIQGQHATFSAEGYSQYYNRLALFDAGKLGKDQQVVYGLAEAKYHAAELRHFIYYGKKIHKNAVFVIYKIVTMQSVAATLSVS